MPGTLWGQRAALRAIAAVPVVLSTAMFAVPLLVQ
jgi:hypothetical protein